MVVMIIIIIRGHVLGDLRGVVLRNSSVCFKVGFAGPVHLEKHFSFIAIEFPQMLFTVKIY